MAGVNLLHHGLFWTLLCFFFLVSTSKEINTTAGQNVTLTCRAPNNNNLIVVVQWNRADLESEYVILYRDGHFVPDEQHPSFKNRVDLQDRQMKDGDVSLILKNVTTADNGTYECRVFNRETIRRKRAHLKTDPISIITLSVVDPPDKKNITAESGQKNVTLTCRAPNNNIIIVEWSRADMKPEYVLVYRGGHFIPEEQHPSFKNRVDLQDRQLKDGDVSLILKNVTTADNGTYECRVFMRGTNNMHLSIITLSVVDPPGQTGGHTEDGGKEAVINRHYGLVAGLIFFAAPVVLLIYRAHQHQNQDSNQPPAVQQTV